MQNNTGYGKTKESIEYWSIQRNTIDSLYESEKHFLLPLLPTANKILDIGCAAGGSAHFTRELSPNSTYYGIDVSEELIKVAQKRFENSKDTFFKSYDGLTFPFENTYFDLAFSFGVFHHISNWKNLALDTLKISKTFIFDIRIWENESIVDSKLSYIKMALNEEWDGINSVPYNLISFNEAFNFFNQLKENGFNVDIYGYYHSPNKLTVTPAKNVLMAMIKITKNGHTPEIKLKIV